MNQTWGDELREYVQRDKDNGEPYLRMTFELAELVAQRLDQLQEILKREQPPETKGK